MIDIEHIESLEGEQMVLNLGPSITSLNGTLVFIDSVLKRSLVRITRFSPESSSITMLGYFLVPSYSSYCKRMGFVRSFLAIIAIINLDNSKKEHLKRFWVFFFIFWLTYTSYTFLWATVQCFNRNAQPKWIQPGNWHFCFLIFMFGAFQVLSPCSFWRRWSWWWAAVTPLHHAIEDCPFSWLGFDAFYP